jgi:glutamyl-Q tRNA(Asp) synthetase
MCKEGSLDNPGPQNGYVGRFAPSPTGPLHFGSLLAALASYLEARSRNGDWLVRIEDLDPPREIPGATSAILQALETYGLEWDREPIYQSRRLTHYQAIIDELLSREIAYFCTCSRQQIAQRGTVYDGFCRPQQASMSPPAAVRLAVGDHLIQFNDQIQGPQYQHLHQEVGDFVIKRKDLLYAYQLAVVVDDYEQGVSHIVRGSDLLESTPRQIYLQQQLGYGTPSYAHIPVIVNARGEKLSKQTYAKPLDLHQVPQTLFTALQVLGQRPPEELRDVDRHDLIVWALSHWDLNQIPRRLNIAEARGPI